MPKIMARTDNGNVVNLEYWDDNTPESDNLHDTNEKLVGVGDLFKDGKFFRGQEEVLSRMEKVVKELEKLREKNTTLRSMLEEYKPDLQNYDSL